MNFSELLKSQYSSAEPAAQAREERDYVSTSSSSSSDNSTDLSDVPSNSSKRMRTKQKKDQKSIARLMEEARLRQEMEEEATRHARSEIVLAERAKNDAAISSEVLPRDKHKRKREKRAAEADEKRERDSEELLRTVFVGNVPSRATLDAVSSLFSQFGVVLSVRFRGIPIPSSKTHLPVALRRSHHALHSGESDSKLAYIVFTERAGADAALSPRDAPLVLHQSALRLDRATARSEGHDVPPRLSIFVGNLPFTATEDEVREHFSPCGRIASVRVSRDRLTGRGRGVAFVQFVEEDAIDQALRLHHVPLQDRPLNVHRCLEREKAATMLAQIKSEDGKRRKEFQKRKKANKEMRSKKGMRKAIRVHAAEFQGQVAVQGKPFSLKRAPKPRKEPTKRNKKHRTN